MQVQMLLRFWFRLGFIVYLEIRLALRLVLCGSRVRFRCQEFTGCKWLVFAFFLI